ncbi:hypothetical protein D0Z07_3462 [Hyphodiscus hymeniophilus]|uniref:Integral membrane protein n=1 Tax=Hyphodiscus hymeniophilus TaxID=353542 RepID=A0A9P6VLF0_9HELO|nr:hypothetical protein D0Z07_3462 [Hyphodiscus hymeniophilus]
MNADEQYETDMVNVLDTLDPEISTLNTLTNVQNSLFVPDLGRYLNRRPTYTLTRRGTGATRAPTIIEEPVIEETAEEFADEEERTRVERTQTITSMTSRLDDHHFAVLPHGERLEGWTAEDRAELNDHVRHLMHSRKEKFKRSMKGFGQYVRKPLGFFVTVYATLITLFGLAWVLFLIGWINVGGRKDYIVNIIDNVLVALFAIIGDGLAPFRAVDTYHMCFIAHYHHLTWRLRKEQALPKLQNRNDLPGLGPTWDTQPDVELETGEKQTENSVLRPKQQKRLVHHQKKFSRSHTFYKPHETTTHFAFPLRLLVAVVVLLDCHSLLQISLGATTWGISYHVRPFALTTVILCCSITCNITAGVLISIGDHKTRKKDVLERMFRQELTSQAIHHLEKKKQIKERQSMDISRADLAASGSGTMNEKEEEDSGVDATAADGNDVERWASAQEHQPQSNNFSTTTTTTTTGPTVTTTTTTREGSEGH